MLKVAQLPSVPTAQRPINYARVFRFKPGLLPDRIPIREGFRVSDEFPLSCAISSICRGIRFVDFPVDENAGLELAKMGITTEEIDVPTLQEYLETKTSNCLELRKSEIMIADALRAIVGRLGEEESVLEVKGYSDLMMEVGGLFSEAEVGARNQWLIELSGQLFPKKFEDEKDFVIEVSHGLQELDEKVRLFTALADRQYQVISLKTKFFGDLVKRIYGLNLTGQNFLAEVFKLLVPDYREDFNRHRVILSEIVQGIIPDSSASDAEELAAQRLEYEEGVIGVLLSGQAGEAQETPARQTALAAALQRAK